MIFRLHRWVHLDGFTLSLGGPGGFFNLTVGLPRFSSYKAVRWRKR